jgi:outer membrane immunogenic protein
MKRFLLTTTSLLAFAHVAGAADLPARVPVKAPMMIPAASWTGFYLGIQGGAVSHRGKFEETSLFPALGSGDADKVGGIIGGYLGYNLQQGAVVYGLEADGSWVGAKATSSWPALGGNTNVSFDVNWLATVRGRLGIASDLTLFYVTGGVAFGGVKNSAVALSGGVPFDSISQSETRVGWTVGGGVERRFGSNWTGRAEVRYVDLGKSDNICAVPDGCGTYSGNFKNSMIQGLVGIGMKF